MECKAPIVFQVIGFGEAETEINTSDCTTMKQTEPPIQRSDSLGGIVLCGGKSSRMGTSKAWLKIGNLYLLQQVTRTLQKMCRQLVVVKAGRQDIPDPGKEAIVVADEYPDAGPLGGIHTGLKQLKSSGVEQAFVTACDCPFLNLRVVQFLEQEREPGSEIVLLTDGKYHHVLSAIYSVQVLETAKKLLDEGRLRPLSLTEFHPTTLIHVDRIRSIDPDLDSLHNLNSPEDYQAAVRRYESLG